MSLRNHYLSDDFYEHTVVLSLSLTVQSLIVTTMLVLWWNLAFSLFYAAVLAVKGHERSHGHSREGTFKITELRLMIAVNATWQGEQCVFMFNFLSVVSAL